MKRTPMKRTPMKRSTPKARARIADWRAERDAHLAKEPRCQYPRLGGRACYGHLEVHHTKPRSMGGTRGETGPLVTLCVAHHGYTESHRSEARALGLLVRREP